MIAAAPSEKRYELVERIAVGGMAEVFRAKAYGPHGFEKALAIKRILPSMAADPKFERRFIAEAKLAVSLSHANIVQVLDFSRFGQSLYIVMEYVDGGDLAHILRIARERALGFPLGAAMHVAIEFLKGLDFAHQRGIVHHDVSPSNILLSRAGEVKIADFGISQAVGSENSRPRRIMGKWRYMSPEQAQGEELDVRSDVFSAGVVLHEVLTGQRLFQGNDAEEIVRNVCTMPIPPASEVRADLPPEVDAPLAAVLERDRDARSMTAAQLLSALLEVCYARSLPALPTELARFLEEVSPPALPRGGGTGSRPGAASGTPRARPALIDQILWSESDPSPPGVRPSAAPAPESTVAATFIRSVADLDGTSRWELADLPSRAGLRAVQPGSDQHPAPDPDADPDAELGAAGGGSTEDEDEDDGDVTRAVEETAPPDIGSPLIIAAVVDAPVLPPPSPWPGVGPPAAKASARGWITIGAGIIAACAVVGFAVARSRGSIPSGEPAGAGAVLPGAAESTASIPAPSPSVPPPPAPSRSGSPPVPPQPAPVEPAPAARAEEPSGRSARAESSRSEPRTGTVDIYSEPWANIYLGKRKVGVAPQRGVRLPIGRHRLRLVNPVLKRSAWVTVTVPASRPVRVELPAP